MEDKNQTTKTQQEVNQIIRDQIKTPPAQTRGNKPSKAELPNLPIRTMAEDLLSAAEKPAKDTPQKQEPKGSIQPQQAKPVPPANLPTTETPAVQKSEPKTQPELKPKIKTKPKKAKTPKKPSAKELAKAEVKTFLKEGQSLFQRKFYKEAIAQLQKASQNPKASFFSRRKAKALIKKSQQALNKQQRIQQKQQNIQKPEKSQPAPKKEFPTEPKKGLNWLRMIMVFLALTLVAAIAYVGVIYFAKNKEPESQPPTQTPEIQPAPDPVRIISGQFQEIIDYKNSAQMIADIKASLNKELRGGFFKNLFFKKVQNFQEKYLTLNELLAATGSQIPAELETKLTGDYNLLIYQHQNTPDKSPFEQDFSSNKRMVLVLKLADKENIDQVLSNWEETMVDDLALLYTERTFGNPKTEEFQKNFYRGTLISYLNFPEPDLSIDYLVLDNLLVLATSRESTFATTDKIMEEI